jgi:hypothetical protein
VCHGCKRRRRRGARSFFLRPSVKELELSVRDAAIVGIRLGRLRTVALAHDLDEALAGVDLVAENLSEVAWLCAKDFLNDGRVRMAATQLRVCRNSGETQEIKTDGWFIDF